MNAIWFDRLYGDKVRKRSREMPPRDERLQALWEAEPTARFEVYGFFDDNSRGMLYDGPDEYKAHQIARRERPKHKRVEVHMIKNGQRSVHIKEECSAHAEEATTYSDKSLENMRIQPIGGKFFVVYRSGAPVDFVAYGSREEAMLKARELADKEGVRVEEGAGGVKDVHGNELKVGDSVRVVSAGYLGATGRIFAIRNGVVSIERAKGEPLYFHGDDVVKE